MKIRLKTVLLACLPLVSAPGSFAQTNYDYANMQLESIDRGMVAIRDADDTVAVSWRYLRQDPADIAFDLYRDGVKLNAAPLAGATFYKDTYRPVDKPVVYELRNAADGTVMGEYALAQDAPIGYINIPLNIPAQGVTPAGDRYTYNANDASIGDVDGDGRYEIILKWEPSNAHDNSHDGYTGNVLLDCYTLDGEQLWRIDLGHNIRAGAHYTQFMVYDLDGDGCAEVVVKTADGTVDGQGNVIGDPDADYREAGKARPNVGRPMAGPNVRPDNRPEGMRNITEQGQRQQERAPQGQWNRDRQGDRGQGDRGQGDRVPGNRPGAPGGRSFRQPPVNQGRILTGPEYLTVFNGRTGQAMATVDYIPPRGNLEDWGDDRANRSDRFLACVAYLDGKHPSVVMCRGYYTRAVLAAYDWDGKELRSRWVFDSDKPGNGAWAGQGNHNLRVADVDGDGCDEIIYGQCAIDHDGTGLYSTGMGHGDAMHLTAFTADDPRLLVWCCHENKRDGSSLRDARTGQVIWQVPNTVDVGRCMAADIDPTNPGVEMWSSDQGTRSGEDGSGGIRNVAGQVVNPDQTTLSINAAVWWDGDLLRELLDHTTITKYDWTQGKCVPVVKFEGCSSNNGTKGNACLSGDIIGDWREEVLLRTNDNSALRLYVSGVPTEYRFHPFVQDIPYRISMATQNVAYNQPPQPGFYFGPDMLTPNE